jgi:actin-related protein
MQALRPVRAIPVQNNHSIESKFNQYVDNSVYELPDKQKLEVSKEMYTVPEQMFEKSATFDGVDRMVELCLEKIDNDYRKELVSNIVLIGGTTPH